MWCWSGESNDAIALEALERGAQDYVVKGTVSGEMLVRALRYALTRHRLMSELRHSDQRQRVLAEQLPAILWTTDQHLRFTSSTGRGLATLGLETNEVVGQTVMEYFETEDPDYPPVALHRRALEGASESANVKWGAQIFHTHVEPLRNNVSEIVGTIGVALDVTDEHKLRRDVEAAHRIQQHLLPSEAPELRGFEIAGQCYPAERCSGDFFDYIPMYGNRLAVVLADVSGHGFGPAILAATIRSYLRTAAVLGNQVHEMLALGNRLLDGDGEANPFASAFSASLDSRTRSIQFSSAGHPAYLLRRNNEVEKLETGAVPIGVRHDEVFTLSRPIRMKRGDVLLLASDGVFETRRPDSEFFGTARALTTIRRLRELPAEEIVSGIYRAACDFAGSERLDDDLTVVIVKAVSRKQRANRPDTVNWPDLSPRGKEETSDQEAE